MKLRRRNDKTRALAFIPDELFAELVRLISVMMNSVVMIVIAPNELCDVVLEDSWGQGSPQIVSSVRWRSFYFHWEFLRKEV